MTHPNLNKSASLRGDIAKVLNRHSAENGSNTPDFILAKFLLGCLSAFDEAVQDRSCWMSGVDVVDKEPTE